MKIQSFPSHPFPEHRLNRKRAKGFTLIELLVVMAVIVILASITFGITRGVQTAQARAKAQGELAVIAQALEGFKLRHGDYPWISMSSITSQSEREGNAHGLLKALTGWQSTTGTQVGSLDNELGRVFTKQDSLLDVSRLTLTRAWPTGGTETSPAANVFFVDPWGNPYLYLYKDPNDLAPNSEVQWERFGYILFSMGPRGRVSQTGFDPTTGAYTDAVGFRKHADNADNIYAGE